jgi:glyoxylase-like metal-dependent hydrolase (beta-lactamase superfamily II)
MVAQYGNATVSRIIDLDPFALPLDFLFPDARLAAIEHARDMLAGTHLDWAGAKVLLAVQSHLLRCGGKTVLIDTCVGEHKPRPARPDWHLRAATRYIANLAAAGCSPDEVDMVMCTHLHADHVGWNTRLDTGRWVPTFANARYLMSQTEIDYRQKEAAARPDADHGSFADSVLPVIDRGLVTAVQAGDTIIEGGRILALPGHAPGQIGLELAAGKDERLLFCGDAIHSPVQVFRPDWSSRFCHDAARAVATRRALLERAVDEGLRLIPAHLRAEGMHVRAANGGFVPVKEP